MYIYTGMLTIVVLYKITSLTEIKLLSIIMLSGDNPVQTSACDYIYCWSKSRLPCPPANLNHTGIMSLFNLFTPPKTLPHFTNWTAYYHSSLPLTQIPFITTIHLQTPHQLHFPPIQFAT